MSSHPTEAYAIAWALFHARCIEDEANPEQIERAWNLSPVRDFWLDQAQIALDAQALHQREVAP